MYKGVKNVYRLILIFVISIGLIFPVQFFPGADNNVSAATTSTPGTVSSDQYIP